MLANPEIDKAIGQSARPMNIRETAGLIGPLRELLDVASRINTAKPEKYWYPLSMATYGLEEILEAIDSLCSFRTSMWEKTAAFETAFSNYLGCREAVMVNSGSSADLLLAFSLINPARPLLAPGDEVLVPAVTWPTQIWSVLMAGLRPVVVDVDPDTLNIDISRAADVITDRTRAIFLVHLMGNPCDMDAVWDLSRANDLLVLEDACEALGATYKNKKVGALGYGGSFSFFFSHHMTTMEGGMLVCQDAELADHFRALRAHGWIRDQHSQATRTIPSSCQVDARYSFINWGFNVRPTDVQAGFGLRQLERLPIFNRIRERFATCFSEFLSGWHGWLRFPAVNPAARPCWLGIPLMVSKDAPFGRDQIVDYLERNGVETRPIVTGSIAHQPVAELFKDIIRTPLPGADDVHHRGFYIGLSPIQTDESMNRLEETFGRFLERF